MPLTLAAAFKSLGVGPIQARLPEFLACLATIPVVFWLGCLLGSRRAGILAALLLSVDNLFVLAARTVRPEAFVTLFAALAVLLYLISRQRKSLLAALLSGVALGAACNFHTNAVGIGISIGLLIFGDFGWSLWRSKRVWGIVAGSIALIIPFVIWIATNAIRVQAFVRLYGRGGSLSLAQAVHGELSRYGDLIGIGGQRLRLISFPIPLRLHVVLLVVAAVIVLERKRRALSLTILALVIPSLLMWPKEMNITARYFAILAPYFALAVALAWDALQPSKARQLLAAFCVLAVVTQLAGNLVLLRQAHDADFAAVSQGLRKAIPPDARVYGAMTFYLALYDRPYFAWHRTPVDYAVDKLEINYLILNDRVLLHGTGHGSDDYREVRENSNAFVKHSADLIGQVPDPFYGNLEIYHVRGR